MTIEFPVAGEKYRVRVVLPGVPAREANRRKYPEFPEITRIKELTCRGARGASHHFVMEETIATWDRDIEDPDKLPTTRTVLHKVLSEQIVGRA